MYYKYGFVLLCLDVLFCVGIVKLEPIVAELANGTAGQQADMYAEMVLENKKVKVVTMTSTLEQAASGQRLIDYEVLDTLYYITKEDYQVLLNIVEAEAGCEDEEGKVMVANVVLNRVKNEAFPNTITEVVYQRSYGITQFSPVSDGSIQKVEISEETCHAVERALGGEDLTSGALYFAARSAADPERMKWFDEHLTFLFAHGGHEFFR